MIIEYEIVIHQLEKAKQSDEFLDIDYDAELERRKKEGTEPLLRKKEAHREVIHNDSVTGESDVFLIYDNEIVTPLKKKRKTNYNDKSLGNLKQYRNKK